MSVSNKIIIIPLISSMGQIKLGSFKPISLAQQSLMNQDNEIFFRTFILEQEVGTKILTRIEKHSNL
jgi:hypothetical protein